MPKWKPARHKEREKNANESHIWFPSDGSLSSQRSSFDSVSSREFEKSSFLNSNSFENPCHRTCLQIDMGRLHQL